MICLHSLEFYVRRTVCMKSKAVVQIFSPINKIWNFSFKEINFSECGVFWILVRGTEKKREIKKERDKEKVIKREREREIVCGCGCENERYREKDRKRERERDKVLLWKMPVCSFLWFCWSQLKRLLHFAQKNVIKWVDKRKLANSKKTFFETVWFKSRS